MKIQKTADKNQYPVTLSEAKRHLHIDKDYNADDDYIRKLIRSVSREAEALLGKDIAYTEVVYTLPEFSGSRLLIPEGSYRDLISVTGDSSTAYSPDVTPRENGFVLDFGYSISADPLTVSFHTGWEQDNVPEDIYLAVLLRIKDYYDVHRSSVSNLSIHNTHAFERLLWNYKNTTP
jgi:hypothetical protein